jgi:1-acyl-sn-glycerol-3-phosphate acyltransferase/nucleoside-diphosphate-sugar epimerase
VLLTGATGFVGSLLLRDLLLYRHTLNIAAGVFVICRGKRSKSAQDRISDLLETEMFSFLTPAERLELVHVLEGDISKPNAGLSTQDMERLLMLPQRGTILTHVIHSAASVSFTQTMADAARANITSTLAMQSLTGRLGRSLKDRVNSRAIPKPRFVHLSTAFVHGSRSGTEANPLPERLFSLDPYDPNKLYESMLGTQFYASKAMSDLQFHNTYAFTKCVCEHLLLQQDSENSSKPMTLIIRPSIVGPAMEYPREGWAGHKPSTIVAAGCLYLSYQWNLWCFGPSYVPSIPVDVLSRFVLRKAFEWEHSNTFESPDSTGSTVSDDSYEQISSVRSVQSISRCSTSSPEPSEVSQDSNILNAAWKYSSAPNALFTWLDYCGATLHFGANMGYFYRSTAYIGLWVTSVLLPRIHLSLAAYERIHHILVKMPMQAILELCRLLNLESLGSKLSKLSNFLDLPLLFFPYMNGTFHFESELSPSPKMDGRRYAFSCVIAAHLFLSKLRGNDDGIEPRTAISRPLSSFVIGGKEYPDSCGLWWALTQPTGNLIIRLAGWVFANILKATCSAVTVDVASFDSILMHRCQNLGGNVGGERNDSKGDEAVHVVLAPTHRSFFDFIILSYMAFVIPELHIDIPRIAAADDFAALPFIGFLAPLLGAFYVKRGRGRADPDLNRSMTAMKQGGSTVFEIFIEGSRSRDRRFLEARTGLLRGLANSGGHHVIVPISISYERIPEQDVLAREASGLGSKKGLNAGGLFGWLMVNMSLGCTLVYFSARISQILFCLGGCSRENISGKNSCRSSRTLAP